jgi:hypothetical protein
MNLCIAEIFTVCMPPKRAGISAVVAIRQLKVSNLTPLSKINETGWKT